MPHSGSHSPRESIPPHGTNSIYSQVNDVYHQLTAQVDVDEGLIGANSPGFGGMNMFLAGTPLYPAYDVPTPATAVSSANAGSSLYGFPILNSPAPVGYQSPSFGTASNTLPELGYFADTTTAPSLPATPEAQAQSFFAPSPKNNASFGALGNDHLSDFVWSPGTTAHSALDWDGYLPGTAGLSPLSALAVSPTAQYLPAFLGVLENGYPSSELDWFADSAVPSLLDAAPSLRVESDLIFSDGHAHNGILQNGGPDASTASRSSALDTYAIGPQRVLDPLQLGSGDPLARASRQRRSPAIFRAGTRVQTSPQQRRSSESRSPSASLNSGIAAKQLKQYPCAAQDCPRTYSRKVDAERHYRGRHELRAPRYIDRCGYGTTRKDHYLRHHGLTEGGQPCLRPLCYPYHACRCGARHEDRNEHLYHVIDCRRGQGNVGRPRAT